MGAMEDVREVGRLVRHQPGFAAITASTVALGVAAATVLFSLVYGVLLKPLPWPDADRLVRLSENRQGATRNFPGALTNASYLAWSDRPLTLESMAAWAIDQATLASESGTAERVDVAAATPSLFPMLRARPLIGAVFQPGDEVPGRPNVLVLSHALWQQRYGGDPHIVGRVVRLDGEAWTVIGVMPADFAFPSAQTRAWRPFYVPPVLGDSPDARRISLFQAMGRLRPGMTPAQASAEGTARSRQAPDLKLVGMAVFGSNGPAEVSAVPALEALTGDVRQPLLLFLAAVALLVITATGNVAGLQLVRATARRREIAIRAALGAGAVRLARPLLMESLAIGLAGGCAGLAIAAGIDQLVPSIMPPRFPRVDAIDINAVVAAFALALSLLCALVFGLVPVVLARRVDLVAALGEDGLAPSGGGRRTATSRARRAIIIGQIAIASVLLVGGSLLARSFVRLLRADRGYDPANVLTSELPLPDASYNGTRRMQLLDHTLEGLRALPGVKAAAAGRGLPLTSREQLMAFTMPSPDGRDAAAEVHAALRVVSDDWFAALGIRIVEGRPIGAGDTVSSRRAVVVNRTFARRYLGNRPVGRTLPLEFDASHRDWEVVGIADDVRQRGVTDPPQPELFVGYRQLSDGFQPPEASIILRTIGDPARFAPIVRDLVSRQDSGLAFASMMTLEDRVHESLAEPRLYALLLGAFACCALLIAGVGLFALLSYSVAQRAREIGVRSAVGARPSDIVRLVAGQALSMTATGLAIGLASAAALVRVLSTLLFGVGPYDPATFAGVAAVLGLVALVAAAMPARHAARVDPAKVLRT